MDMIEASGSIATFECSRPVPLRSCSVSMDPEQDLHGYNNPWPAGGGKNLVSLNLSPAQTERNLNVNISNRSDKSITLATISAGSYSGIGLFYTLPAGTYSIRYQYSSVNAGIGGAATVYNAANNSVISSAVNSLPPNSIRTFTLGEETKIEIRLFITTTSAENTATISDLQLSAGSTLDAWSPYSNICPITGRTGLKVMRTGKNLFNLNRTQGTPSPSNFDKTTKPRVMDIGHYYKGITRNNYYITNSVSNILINGSTMRITGAGGGYGVGFPVDVKPNTQYTFSANEENIEHGFGYYDLNWNFLSFTESYHRTITITTPSNCKYCVIVCVPITSNVEGTISNIQLELGSTATSYEPYKGQIFEADWGKNLFNPGENATADGTTTYGVTIKNNRDGSYTFNGTATASAWFNFGSVTLPAGTYTMSFKSEGSYSNGNVKIGANDGVFITYPNLSAFPWTKSSEQETTGIFGINFQVGTVVNNFRIWVQIESGSIATSYAPYVGIGTIYGGTLDVATGELVVDRRIVTASEINSSEGRKFSPADVSHGMWVYRVDDAEETLAGTTNEKLLCNILPTSNQNYVYNAARGGRIGCAIWWSKQLGIATNDATVNNLPSFKQWCVDNDIVLIYPLATPLTYHLTPKEVTTIVGQNHVWSDAGDISVAFDYTFSTLGLDIRRAAIIASQPHPEEASGAIVSFTGERFPLKACIADINPVQDLHGYDNPWPAGGGKNKVDCTNLDLGELYNRSIVLYDNESQPISAPFHVQVKYSTTPSGTNAMMYFYCTDDTIIMMYYQETSKTINKDVKKIVIANWVQSTTGKIEYIQVENGSTFTGYAPYSNICPITGWTGAMVTRTGKNLQPSVTATGNAITYGGVTLSTNGDVISLSGTANSNGGRTTLCLQHIYLKAGKYYISTHNTSGEQPVALAQIFSGSSYTVITDRTPMSFVLSQDSEIVVGFNLISGIAYSSTLQLQIELGPIATSYEPYTGQTVDVDWGRNQWNEEWENGIYNNVGEKRDDNTSIRSKNHINVLPNTKYYYKAPENSGRICYYDANKNYLSRSASDIANSEFTTPDGCYYITFYNMQSTYGNDISINYPSIFTQYVPYVGIGTVYGGTLDVTTGELVVDRICVTFNGTFNDIFSSSSYVNPAESDPSTDSAFCLLVNSKYLHSIGKPLNAPNPTGYCSILKNDSFTNINTRNAVGFSVQGNWSSAFLFYYPGLKTKNDWLNWFSSNSTHICYELATPIVYHLTPNEITALLGENHMWADTGNLTVKYWKH